MRVRPQSVIDYRRRLINIASGPPPEPCVRGHKYLAIGSGPVSTGQLTVETVEGPGATDSVAVMVDEYDTLLAQTCQQARSAYPKDLNGRMRNRLIKSHVRYIQSRPEQFEPEDLVIGKWSESVLEVAGFSDDLSARSERESDDDAFGGSQGTDRAGGSSSGRSGTSFSGSAESATSTGGETSRADDGGAHHGRRAGDSHYSGKATDGGAAPATPSKASIGCNIPDRRRRFSILKIFE